MTDVTIRDATPADAAGIVNAHVGSWRTTYRGHFPDDLLDNVDVPLWTANRERMLRELPPDQFYLVAEVGGKIAGFRVAGPSRDGPEDAEVYAIYLLAEHQCRGIGRALVREAVRRFRTRGMRSMVIWVLRENAIGRAFYERLGGIADHEKQDTVGGRGPGQPRHPVIETAYVRTDISALDPWVASIPATCFGIEHMVYLLGDHRRG